MANIWRTVLRASGPVMAMSISLARTGAAPPMCAWDAPCPELSSAGLCARGASIKAFTLPPGAAMAALTPNNVITRTVTAPKKA